MAVKSHHKGMCIEGKRSLHKSKKEDLNVYESIDKRCKRSHVPVV